MKRRDFLGTAGAGALLSGGMLSGCGKESAPKQGGSAAPQETIEWKMVTTWP